MLRCFRLAIAILPVLCLLTVINAEAQTPVALPYTMTTLAGTSPMAATAGTQCPNLPAGIVSADAFGDGCLAVNGIFGAAGRGGVQVDSFGNVFVADDVDGIIHAINPSTGIMTKLAGLGTACAGKLDSSGDGCLAATQTVMGAQRGIGLDPYGNVLGPGYGDHLAHIICRTASPLCVTRPRTRFRCRLAIWDWWRDAQRPQAAAAPLRQAWTTLQGSRQPLTL
jgi:hypothetical protein